jgi:phosphoribosylglycinamide formyltransferase-1
MRVVVLASGRGSNLQALIAAVADGRLPARIVGVFSDKARAPALEHARAAGIPAHHLDSRAYPDRAAYDHALFARIGEFNPDLVVLAGFMRILDPSAFSPWLGRIVNIHPSLLPKYPGLHTHRRALEAGDTLHGSTVHFVSAELDGGPRLSRVEIGIDPDDTPESLAARLLPHEHRLIVASVGLLASGHARWTDAGVCLDGCLLANPLRLRENNELVPDSG